MPPPMNTDPGGRDGHATKPSWHGRLARERPVWSSGFSLPVRTSSSSSPGRRSGTDPKLKGHVSAQKAKVIRIVSYDHGSNLASRQRNQQIVPKSAQLGTEVRFTTADSAQQVSRLLPCCDAWRYYPANGVSPARKLFHGPLRRSACGSCPELGRDDRSEIGARNTFLKRAKCRAPQSARDRRYVDIRVEQDPARS